MLDKHIIELIEKIKNNDPDLVEVNLYNQRIGDEGAIALAEAIKSNTTITSINLQFNDLTVIGIKAISDVIKDSQTIKLLKIGLNHISLSGAESLSRIISVNNHIEILDIGFDASGVIMSPRKTIENEGASLLLMAVVNNPESNLKHLNLSGNNISDAALAEVITLIEKNNTLQEVSLADNKFTRNSIKQMAIALKNNAVVKDFQITFLDLYDTNITINLRHCNIDERIQAQIKTELAIAEMPPNKIICQQEINDKLKTVMAKYQQIANGNGKNLRNHIPIEEMWRFFVESEIQTNGRGLKNKNIIGSNPSDKSELFYDNLLTYTLAKYIAKVEGKNLKSKRLHHESDILRILYDYNWGICNKELSWYEVQNFKVLDQAWMPFEHSEPGYLNAMLTAFNEIFKTEQDIDKAFINQLHCLALSEVTKTNYDNPIPKYCNEETTISTKGNIRISKMMTFGLEPKTMSIAGIEQILEKQNPHIYLRLNYENSSILVSLESIEFFKAILSRFDEFLKMPYDNTDDEYKLFIHYFEKLNALSSFEREKAIITHLTMIGGDIHKLSQFIMGQYKKCEIKIHSEYKEDPKECITHDLEILLSEYSASIQQAFSPLERLTAIIVLVQSLEQLHPYLDGNCRTLVMLLLNFLLLKNGFPLAILDNPNKFDAYSVDELLLEVVQGMENTFYLIENGELFNVNTQTFMQNLCDMETYGCDRMVEYFNTLMNKEREYRSNPTSISACNLKSAI